MKLVYTVLVLAALVYAERRLIEPRLTGARLSALVQAALVYTVLVYTEWIHCYYLLLPENYRKNDVFKLSNDTKHLDNRITGMKLDGCKMPLKSVPDDR